ncbi:phosphotransferase [Streptomyces rimosus]|uniref:phosphotransferase n=1 Tax=Streptomyces rimosus TaxID=1927 RepID=UPI0037B6E6FB
MPSDAERSTQHAFTSGGAARVLAGACRRAGLDSDGARLIRLGENALFRLAAHPVVVRIARSREYLDAVRGEVRVSRWLSRTGFPVTRVVDDLEQPVVVDGHPVTFWHVIEEGPRKPTYGELGAVLRDLHSLTVPDTLALPPYPALGRTDRRIATAAGIPEDDRAFLRKRAGELRERVAGLRFESRKCAVHGDALRAPRMGHGGHRHRASWPGAAGAGTARRLRPVYIPGPARPGRACPPCEPCRGAA